jgi:hypothetical protein
MIEWKEIHIDQVIVKPNGFAPLTEELSLQIFYTGLTDFGHAKWIVKVMLVYRS